MNLQNYARQYDSINHTFDIIMKNDFHQIISYNQVHMFISSFLAFQYILVQVLLIFLTLTQTISTSTTLPHLGSSVIQQLI